MGGLKLDEGFYGSPRWTYEILDCAMPMTFDTYSNCAHQCLYCFSFFQRAIGDGADDYLHHKVRPVNTEKIKRMFLHPEEHGGQFAGYIKKRMVLQWGGLSDGFDWYERKFRKSLELLKFFREIDYPISISTKGVWWVDDPEYIEVCTNAKNMHWKYSIISSIEEHVKKIEPGVPTARARFKAMEKLNKMGVGATTLRFRPFVLGTSDKCIEEMMTMGEDAGCYSVTTEFLTWESRASVTSKSRLDAMSKTLGYDIWDFYMKNSARASGLLRLNYDLKRPYILEMKESAARHNLKFFVSDAHHKEDSYHAGCCGLPETGPLSNVNHGQYAHAILIAKEKGFVRWADIKDEAEEVLGKITVYAAEGFPSDSVERAKRRYQNMDDYMHDIWNTPNSWQSPNRYFGGALVAGGLDDDGDIIYLYNKPFIEEGIRIGTVNELAIQLRMAGKPNAERYDEMVADGTDYGHVAYPVYVISRKRWATATTMAMLDKSRINYNLLVPKSDLNYYAEQFPNADIMTLDKGVTGTGAVRAAVVDICREQGYPYVWILDDDITSVSKGEEPSTLRALFSTLERFIEDYSNVAMLGVSLSEEVFRAPFLVNQPVRGLMLVNLQLGRNFDPAYQLYEDYEFALQNISNGNVTVVHNAFRVKFAEMPGGGASGLYLKGDDAKKLNEAYPAFTELEYRQDNIPPRIHMDWRGLTSSLKSRNVELLMKGE
jgi:DNA repair photolyase